MGKIRKIGDKYVADFINAVGKRKRLFRDTKKEAADILAEVEKQNLLREMGIAHTIEPEVPEVHLADAIEQFHAGRVDRTNRGAEKGYFSNLYRFLHEDALDSVRVDYVSEVTTSLLDAYMSKRLQSVSASSVVREIAIFKVFFKMCVGFKWIKESPMIGTRKVREKRQPRMQWREDQVELILPVLPVWAGRVAASIAMMGHRPISLARLNWSDVVWDEQALLVTSWKNALEPRKKIGMSAQAASFLKGLYMEAMKGGRAEPNDPVYVNAQGERFTVDNFVKVFAKTRDEVGLPAGLTSYGMRHRFADQLVDKGVDMFTLKGLMGHSKLSTTERYVNRGTNQHSEAANRIVPLKLVN